jgi:hypothetical protein
MHLLLMITVIATKSSMAPAAIWAERCQSLRVETGLNGPSPLESEGEQLSEDYGGVDHVMSMPFI